VAGSGFIADPVEGGGLITTCFEGAGEVIAVRAPLWVQSGVANGPS
jgi:hypothetical protein